MILKMLDEGKIGPEEAEKLLAALGDKESPEKPKDKDKDWDGTIDNITEKAVNFSEKAANMGINLAENIMDNMSGFFNKLEEGNIGSSFSGRSESELYDFEIELDNHEKISLDIKGANESIKIKPSHDNIIRVSANVSFSKAALKNRPEDGFYNVEREGSTIFFRPMLNENLGIRLEIFLPSQNYGDVVIKNRNAKVEISQLLAERLEVTTKNASLDIENIDSSFILLETKNGKIKLDSVKAGELNAHSTNGKILISAASINKLNATTSNSLIDIDNLNADKTFLTTTNSGINVKTLEDFDGYFNLRTNIGSVDINLDSVVYDTDKKNIKVGRSVDYDPEKAKEIIATTSNGSIRIG